MSDRPGSASRRWLKLALAAAAAATFLVVAQLVSPSLPGAAGKVYEQNCSQGIDASALFYTEVTDVHEFSVTGDGRYAIDVRPGLRLGADGE